jgi:hypothetical protein
MVAGSVMVAGAIAPGPRVEALVAPAAYGGPVGRLAVAGPWVVRLDPDDGGRAQGFPQGRFDGMLATVPHVANATPVTGAGGQRGFRGGIAW